MPAVDVCPWTNSPKVLSPAAAHFSPSPFEPLGLPIKAAAFTLPYAWLLLSLSSA